MKRIISVIAIMALMLCLVSCGSSDSNKQDSGSKEAELAMVADGDDMDEGSFADTTWKHIETFAADNELTARCYVAEEQKTTEAEDTESEKDNTKEKDKSDTKDKAEKKESISKEESYMMAVEKAVDNKAKLIVMTGNSFATTVYEAQSAYPDVKFLLINGMPHDSSNNYATAENTIGVVFAEEEAGYLAGYAAVKDGYKKLGFVGGGSLPDVKRYGYGFVQGAAAAAAELEKKVELSYAYAGESESLEDVQKLAAGYYKDGIQVIFACGGNVSDPVIKAAENNNGKVIGAGVDQSYLSSTVITSAKDEIGVVIEEMIDNYVDEKFVGGTAFNYNAKNGGVGLEIENAQFSKFNDKDYAKVFKQLKNGKIQLKKDTSVDSVSDLVGEWVTIKK